MDVIVGRFDDFLINDAGLRSEVAVADGTEHKQMILGFNVCYVVAAIAIENDKVLMQREAKHACYGKWYLPAGRMEKNETIKDAVKREVKEETSMDIEPMNLLCVESTGAYWFRFTFAVRCVGGNLKNTEDKESIEAKWIPISDVYEGNIDLRHYDIIALIKQAEIWYKASLGFEAYYLQPVLQPHTLSVIRVYLVSFQLGRLYVFIGRKNCLYSENIMHRQGIKYTSETALSRTGFNGDVTFHGVIGLEHSGDEDGKSDGLLISILAETKDAEDKQHSKESWKLVTDSYLEASIKCIITKKLCAQLFF